jgi:serine/threonine protein kinase
MELVDGVSVADLLDQRGRLSVSSTLAIATQLCDALAIAHEASIIHRDIKPANLVVDHAAVLKVMDFGIARSVANEAEPRHTGHGHVVGTPRYMAPELLTGEKASVRTDLYAVGVVVYECLTGHLPFSADTPAELVGQIYQGSFESLERILPNIPPKLARVVHQQLNYDARQRAGSARELGHKLSEIEFSTEPGRQREAR